MDEPLAVARPILRLAIPHPGPVSPDSGPATVIATGDAFLGSADGRPVVVAPAVDEAPLLEEVEEAVVGVEDEEGSGEAPVAP